jgi:phage/plasmid-like protein (TIGR03299 family)
MIEFVDGKPCIAYAGEVPWHGLGKRVPPDLTPEQMMKAAGVDWEVTKVPTRITWNKKPVLTGLEALVRSTDGKILTHVSPDWNPVQNSEAFQFFYDFVMAGDMEMHTAGSIRDGQYVWVLAKVNDEFTLFNGDSVEAFLLFTNPHLYGASIDVRFTPVRTVCNNTLTLALSQNSTQMVKLNHRRKFDAAEVKQMLGIADMKLKQYKEMAEFLGSKRYKQTSLTKYFGDIFPISGANVKEKKLSRNAEIALGIVETQPGHEFAPGSWWQAFNAVTFMTDHVIGNKADTRLYKAWYGPMQKLKVTALEKAVKQAQVA